MIICWSNTDWHVMMHSPVGDIAVDCGIFCSQTCKETQDIGALTKAADFVKAFVLGFQVEVSV